MNSPLRALVLAPSLLLAAPAFAHGWDATGLEPEMKPLAKLESADGLLLEHRPSPKGEFYTAFGPLGFKPSSAYDEYLTSPRLQKKYPVKDAQDFFEQFTTNPVFYNTLASQHWAKLKRLAGGDSVAAAFGWHYGVGGLQRASYEQIHRDGYAAKYQALTTSYLASN